MTRWRDAHLHLLELGQSLSAVQLGDCDSIDAVLEQLAQGASELPPGQWLVARGLQPQRLAERCLPIATQIDRAVIDRPCALWTLDLHSMATNTRALRAAGLLDRSAATLPRGGSIGGSHGVVERDASGAPTGVLLEAAAGLVASAIPAPDDAARREQLRAAIAHLQSHGIVETHEMFARADVMLSLMELERTGELQGFCMLAYATREHLPAVRDAMAACESAGPVQLGGLKLFLDGTLNSRTAFMLEPFADPLPDYPRGMANYTPETLLDELRFAEHERLDVAAHAIGDAAVRRMLDAHDALAGELGHEPKMQLRIEHAQFIDKADVPRFARKGKAKPIIASVQPCHLLTDMEPIRRLLPHRAERAFAMRDLVDAAIDAGRDPADCIWLGSDAPVVPPDPQDNRQACTERRRTGMSQEHAIAPAQAIDATMWEALQKVPAASL